MTTSASFRASALTTAPAAKNSESGRPDLIPAPGSTATSQPNALNFFTVSGEAATRGSEGSISLATAIFMRPPTGKVDDQSCAISAENGTVRNRRPGNLESIAQVARRATDQVRKIAIRARITTTLAVPYFTSLRKPS